LERIGRHSLGIIEQASIWINADGDAIPIFTPWQRFCITEDGEDALRRKCCRNGDIATGGVIAPIKALIPIEFFHLTFTIASGRRSTAKSTSLLQHLRPHRR
jgi:hypothetical protein